MTILESLWFIYGFFYYVPVECPSNGCPLPPANYFLPLAALALAVALLLVGGLGIWGASVAYLGGAVLSVVALLIGSYTIVVLSGYPYLAPQLDYSVVGIIFSASAIVLNLVAFRKKERLSEQANPMNLPVFG